MSLGSFFDFVVRYPAGDHATDDDCTPDPDTGVCLLCGVLHGDPCDRCGGRAFHLDGCPIVAGEAS